MHTTKNSYITFIQHTNTTRKTEKLSGKEKLALIEVIKVGTYVRIGFRLLLYSLTKQTRPREEVTKNQINLQTGKEVMHQSLTIDEQMRRVGLKL